MELINVSDPTETKPTQENYQDQIEELKNVIKNMKEAAKNDVSNLNERTKGLEKNKIWQALTNEENTLIVDKINLNAAKDEKAAYLIGEPQEPLSTTWHTPAIPLTAQRRGTV